MSANNQPLANEICNGEDDNCMASSIPIRRVTIRVRKVWDCAKPTERGFAIYRIGGLPARRCRAHADRKSAMVMIMIAMGPKMKGIHSIKSHSGQGSVLAPVVCVYRGWTVQSVPANKATLTSSGATGLTTTAMVPDEGNPESGGAWIRVGPTMCGGTLNCRASELECDQNNTPVVETCNGEDDDCDGVDDNGFALGVECVVGLGECRFNRADRMWC